VFDAEEFRDFVERIRAHRIPLIAGITPLESARHAEFMANEVPGVRVPEAVVERMRRADADGRAADEGSPSPARSQPPSARWSRASRSRPHRRPSTWPSA
jgi:5,10-methylenetetrahydrofolate reductase